MNKALRITALWMDAGQFAAWPGDGTGRHYQLIDGEPCAMAPPSQMHGLVQANLVIQLGAGLRAGHSPCKVVIGPGVQPRPDMERNVRVPDVAVTCTPDKEHFVNRPVFVAEILSPSNARETRDAIRAMLSVPSLCEVLVIGSERKLVELLTRGADGHWPAEPAVYGTGDTIELVSLGVSLSVDALYDGLGLT